MMKRWAPVTLLLIVSLFIGCNSNDDSKVHIHGNFDFSNQEMIYLELLHVDRLQTIDSIQLDENGGFSFYSQLAQPEFVILKVNANNFITILAEPGEEVVIHGDIRQLARTFRTEKSENAMRMFQLEQHRREIFSKFDSLMAYWEEHRYDTLAQDLKDSLDLQSEKYLKQHKQTLESFIKEKPDNLSNIIALYQRVARTNIFEFENDLKLFELVGESLSKKYPNNEHVLDLRDRIEKYKTELIETERIKENLKAGKTAPDFNFMSMSGERVSLTNSGSQSKLLYFWKIRNTKSRLQNQELKAYKEKHKDLNVIQICVDDRSEHWTQAIQIDQLEGIQLIGESEGLKQYNIDPFSEEYPKLFLLDEENKILYTDFELNQLDSLLQL